MNISNNTGFNSGAAINFGGLIPRRVKAADPTTPLIDEYLKSQGASDSTTSRIPFSEVPKGQQQKLKEKFQQQTDFTNFVQYLEYQGFYA